MKYHTRQHTSPYFVTRFWLMLLLYCGTGCLLLLPYAAHSAAPPTPTPLSNTTSPPDSTATDTHIVRIYAPTNNPHAIQQLIHLDIDLLEMRDGNDLFAIVTPEQHHYLATHGWQVAVDAEQTALLHRSAAVLQTEFTGYHTVEQIEQQLQELAIQYPELTTLVDFGDSWERTVYGESHGYDLYALRITNKHMTPAAGSEKPVLIVLGTVHARELVPTEVVIDFTNDLLQYYNVDPNVTWLLNEHEVVVVPVANPDGRKIAEQGYYHRKNTNTSYSTNCNQPSSMTNQVGVDLNRNFAYQWGIHAMPTMNPCEVVFPGGTAASEPETQALQDFIRSLFPHHTPINTLSLPTFDTSGILVTLHSYGNLVLWPWGYSYMPAPHDAMLAQLGTKFTTYNNYTPEQSVALYPTSGTTDDWSYGALGIASYTFEIGSAWGVCGGFMPPFTCISRDDMSLRNRRALLYAARVARAPYTQPSGSEVSDIHVFRDTSVLTVTALATSSEAAISQASVSIGTSQWNNATTIAMQPVDGAFNGTNEQLEAIIPLDVLSDTMTATETNRSMYNTEHHLLVVQSQVVSSSVVPVQPAHSHTTAGIWGVASAEFVPSAIHFAPTISVVDVVSDTYTITVTAHAIGNQHTLQSAEVYIGNYPWNGGVAVPLVAQDDGYDSTEERVFATLSREQLTQQLVVLQGAGKQDAMREELPLYLRAKTDEWGHFTSVIVNPLVMSHNILVKYQTWLPMVHHP